MILKEDGTKWVCRPCLVGHRVGRCNHTDRDLVIVPHKGRPVTQCQHCRLERKKRSAHIKCNCADISKLHHAKENCLHLGEGGERARNESHDGTYAERHTGEDVAHLIAIAEQQGCCCHHGGKCSCAIFLGNPSESRESPIHHPLVETASPVSTIAVSIPGHSQYVRRNKGPASGSSMPYNASMTQSQTSQELSTMASRSVGDLARTQTTHNTSTANMTFKEPALHQLPDFAGNTSLEALSSYESAENSPWTWPMPDDVDQVVQPATRVTSSSMPLEVDEVSLNNNLNSLAIWEDVGNYDLETMELINSPPSNRGSMLPDFFLSADIVMDNLNHEWLGTFDDGLQYGHNLSLMDSSQLWQAANFPPTSQYPPRGSSGLCDTTQSQWRSAYNDDILAELFPHTGTNGSRST